MRTALLGIAIAAVLTLGTAQAADEEGKRIPVHVHQVHENIVKMGVAEGIDPQAAAASMEAKATQLNMDLVARIKVHNVMAERGVDTRHLEILQFCQPEDAVRLVQNNPVFSVFLPCRISMVEDESGKLWLYLINLDMEIDSQGLPPVLQEVAIRINQHMLAILTAGATGIH